MTSDTLKKHLASYVKGAAEQDGEIARTKAALAVMERNRDAQDGAISTLKKLIAEEETATIEAAKANTEGAS